jgi:hypothetical protein
MAAQPLLSQPAIGARAYSGLSQNGAANHG